MLNLLRIRSVISAALLVGVTSVLAFAQGSAAGPQPVPLPPPIIAPVDTAYSGVIKLEVDASDVAHRIIQIHEVIPVHSAQLTLLYPEWIPGNHSPTGPISKIAGLEITANEKPIEWVRDRVNVYAFHIKVPAGVQSLDVRFQYLPPLRANQGRVSFSDKIIDLAWNTVVLYPAGHFSRRIVFSPSLRLPDNWQFASALDVASHSGSTVQFKDTPLNTLIDSPLYAGLNFKRVDLSTGADNQVFLDVFADSPANLEITPEELRTHKNLTVQAAKLYASHHYSHYDFLLLLSETVGGIGLEHHQSSEDGASAKYFNDWAQNGGGSDLLAHEYTHSWNGKFRRPADLWTPNFNVPMQDDLLWVYEGMTQYWGYVLTARAEMRSAEQTRDLIALVAANFDASAGRTWRPLVDTTNQPTISQRSPVTWVSWERPEDYYTEGMLIWLDADTKIRELSGGKKSLDDFAKKFFGVDNGSYVTETYTFDDLVAALSSVQAYDWAAFFRTRVYEVAPHTPEDGITRGGYRLAYSDTKPEWLKRQEKPDGFSSYATSLGFSVKSDGELGNVWWDSVAFKAGIAPDMQLMAVNDTKFTQDVLRDAVLAAEKTTSPIKLLMKSGIRFQTVEVNYHEGLRYPKLVRVDGTPDRLGDILTPLK